MQSKCNSILVAALGMMGIILFSLLPVFAEQNLEGQQLKLINFKPNLERLSKEQFQARFGDNPEIPRSNEGVLSLAKKLYSREGREEIKQECGEAAYGALYAALSNPEITEDTINTVSILAYSFVPPLTSTYTEGHFRFFYTTTDPDPNQNVTLDDIKATAKILNNAWDDFVVNFKEPLCYTLGGVKEIDIFVYYLGAGAWGETDVTWNFIMLNSKEVVKDYCRRKTTPVHELFHRVEYSYGYISGMANMSWASEGCAAWSQKYRAPNVGDWMRRMNQGLNVPNANLFARSYDACHFWCYLGQRASGGGSGGSESIFIRKVWSFYEVNGKNMVNAVDAAIRNIIGSSYSFDAGAAWWMFANFDKDLANANFDYVEDEWGWQCNGIIYGPLVHAPHTTVDLNPGSVYVNPLSSAASYGADYYVFNVGAGVTRIELSANALFDAKFAFAVIEIKNGAQVYYQRDPTGGRTSVNYAKNYTPGQITQLALLVMGIGGGPYFITARAY